MITHKFILVTFLMLISILFAAFNGMVIRWKQAADAQQAAKWSVRWHGVGLCMHILTVGMFAYAGGWIWACAGLFANWILYNIIIALLMNQKWYYVGKTAWFDKLIRKLLPFINFDK